MEDFDIGKRSITVEMDRPRELIYNHSAMRAMEDLAHRWAKKMEVTVPGGLFSSLTIMNNLGNDNLFSIALWGALRKDSPKMSMEDVDDIYENYLEKTGDRQDLIEILLEAYARAKNPRRLSSMKEMEKIKQETKDLIQKGSLPGAGEKPHDEPTLNSA